MVEIHPGGIKKLGKIYPQRQLGLIGEQVTTSREKMFEQCDASRAKYRYQIYARRGGDTRAVGDVYIDESLYEWLENCSDLMTAGFGDEKKLFWTEEGIGKLGQSRGMNIQLLYQEEGLRLGWHIDQDLDVRLMTNIGQEETVVWAATEWGSEDLSVKPDDYRIPKDYEIIVLEPGETYVVNNIVYFRTPGNSNLLTPHATPVHSGRSILQQAFEWLGSSEKNEWSKLRELGGVTVCTELDSSSIWVPGRSFCL